MDKEIINNELTNDNILNSIIKDSIIKGASDIHFDTTDDGIKVSFKIDGELQEYTTLSKNIIDDIKPNNDLPSEEIVSEKLGNLKDEDTTFGEEPQMIKPIQLNLSFNEDDFETIYIPSNEKKETYTNNENKNISNLNITNNSITNNVIDDFEMSDEEINELLGIIE